METVKRHATPLGATAVLVLALGCYLNTLGHGFVNWDDGKLILENEHVRGLTLENLRHIWTQPIHETYLPLRATSYALDYSLWGGYDPMGFHLTNVVLHGVVSLLVFAIARRLTGSDAAALFSGVLFAVHPVCTEPVAWASGRKDLLSTALLLGAYLAYLGARGLPRTSAAEMPAGEGSAEPIGSVLTGISVGLFFFSGLAKAMVVTLPVFIVMTDFVFGGTGRGRWKRLLPVWAAYLAAAAVLTWVAMHFAASAGAIRPWHFGGPGRTALFMSWVALYYVKTMAWPNFLSARYPYGDTADFGVPEWQVYAAPFVLALSVAALAVVFWKARAGGRWPAWGKVTAFGFGWFFVALMPVMNIIPIQVLVADRYLYLPSVGWALASGGLLWYAWGGRSDDGYGRRRRIAAAVVFVALAAGASARTVSRNMVWRDSLSLWSSVVEEFPDSAYARRLLADAYIRYWPPDEESALRELAIAEELDPDSGRANLARAILYRRMGLTEKALDERAIGMYRVGRIEYQKGNFDDARGYYMLALDVRPFHRGALLGLARVEIESGRPGGARAALERLLEADGQDEDALRLLNVIDNAGQGDQND